jgi:signal transduction histidine kinase
MRHRLGRLLSHEENRGGLEYAVVAALSLVFLLAIGVIGARYATLQRLSDDQARMTRGYRLQKELGDVIAVFRGAEFFERSYLASNADAGKTSYKAYIARLPQEIQDVRALLLDNPVQLQKLEEVEQILKSRLKILDGEVESRQLAPASVTWVTRDEDVVERLQAMIDDEQTVLDQGGHKLYDRMATNLVYLDLAVTTALFSIGILVGWLVHQLRQRVRIQRDLAAANTRAEAERVQAEAARQQAEADRLRADDARRKAEESREEANAANRSKSLFLANISHEIRTPLNAIMGFTELLEETALGDPERPQYLAAVRRNCQLLTQIIDDTLDLAKVEAGKLHIELQRCSLAELLTDVSMVMSREARRKGLQFHVASSGTVPEQIETDPVRLRQILINVIGNAIKFTAEGSVDVGISAEDCVGPRGRLTITVTDTGPGISLEQQGRLFQPFSQADASMTRRFGGTGLGLLLSQRLARALGGDVELTKSIVGQGSTFTVTCACVLGATAGADGQKPRGDTAAGGRPDRTALFGMRVLVVEDSPDNRLLTATILKNCGAAVDLAGDGREAVTMAMRAAYDLVLMDLQMPVTDGLTATAELRRLGFRAPIMALSATILRDDLDRCRQAGCDDAVLKPITAGVLIERVSRLRQARSH